MLKLILGSLAFAAVLTGIVPDAAEAAEAADSRTKARRAAADNQPRARPATRRESASSRTADGERTPALRDRSTFYHRDGRLNGKELFEQINERGEGGD